MIIRINEKESYSIEFQEEITSQQFFELLGRLKHIERLIGRDPLLNTALQSPKTISTRKKSSRSKKFNYDREEAVRLFIIHYYGTFEEKQDVCEEYNNCEWDDLTKGLHYAKKKWNIQPQEVGLIRFPTKGAPGNVRSLRIPNWKKEDNLKGGENGTEAEKEEVVVD